MEQLERDCDMIDSLKQDNNILDNSNTIFFIIYNH